MGDKFFISFPKNAMRCKAAYCLLYLWLLDNVYIPDDLETGLVKQGRKMTLAYIAGKLGQPRGTVQRHKSKLEGRALVRTEGDVFDPEGQVWYVRNRENWDDWDNS